jgi:nitric oxide reductase NorD protein
MGSNTALELHEVKGVLTKVMRMLFPLEFRIDSLANFSNALPFRFPFATGEVIHLPESVDGLGSHDNSFDYYLMLATHLAGRHEFGTYEIRLADLPGFEERGEVGLEALSAFVWSFPDPQLASALMRLCEAARIDSALARRYRGLAPRIELVDNLLVEALPQTALSTMLIRAAFNIPPNNLAPQSLFVDRAGRYFAPLRESEAVVADSACQTNLLYQWFQNLMKAAATATDPGAFADDAARARDELSQSFGKGDEGQTGSGEDEGEINPQDGSEPNQQVSLQTSGKRSKGGGGEALSAEEIRRMLEQGAELKPSEGEGSAGGDGMYLTQLLDKHGGLKELREQLAEAGTMAGHGHLVIGPRAGVQDSYYAYDEWDYVANDYRRNWCRLREMPMVGDEGDFFARTLERYSELLPLVRRHFQRIRPASYRLVRGLEDGEEIDLDRMVEARVSLHMGESPDTRVYKARKKEARDVATLFLLDMSASTDEPIQREPRRFAEDDNTEDDWLKAWQRRPTNAERPRRIIDVNKEALVIMAQALEEIGDSYAIMGFSGHGRDNVEFYVIKEFNDQLSDDVRSRVGAVEPKRSTRMGTAIRHVREKFKDVSSMSRHVILLSDGFPQDFDYGQDRRSNTYGIQDTMVALKELELSGVLPFCITVDRTGHDYLREMCQSSRYLVIDDIKSLPRELPKIYEQIVRW